ncbi:hypothetical protein ACFC0X_25055 [Paenibacillus chitinolyticus]|uniref:hypothetical protein n=1 Tax=Paenibacillus chitinolyticus TaxID=79263 RepID=UPI0035E08FD0
MAHFNAPSVDAGMSQEEFVEVVGKLIKQVQFLFDRNIDTKNTREIGGWLVSLTGLVSNDRDVGMSTDDEGIDPIRFFAGDNWNVTKSGKMTATGATIQSRKDSYPRVEMSSKDDLIGAYQTPYDSIVIVPTYGGGPPTLYMVKNNAVIMQLTHILGAPTLMTSATIDLAITGGGNLDLSATTGNVRVTNWGKFQNRNSGQTLQQALDSKASNSPINGTVYVSSTPGGPANTAITFTGGIRTG